MVEDTQYSLETLKTMGYSDAILTAVALLTKDKSVDYDTNINRIISSGNKRATSQWDLSPWKF